MRDLIRAALTDEDRYPPWRGEPNLMKGQCYVASECYYYLVGGTPHTVIHEDTVHWYIVHDGEIVDLTADQFETPVPYHLGRSRGFLTNYPSHRARTVMERIKTWT